MRPLATSVQYLPAASDEIAVNKDRCLSGEVSDEEGRRAGGFIKTRGIPLSLFADSALNYTLLYKTSKTFPSSENESFLLKSICT